MRVFFLLLLSCTFLTQAKQITFQKSQEQYYYQWLDEVSGEIHELQFSLPLTNRALSKFIRYRPLKLQQYVEKKLRLHIKTYDPRKVQFDVKQGRDGLKIEYRTFNLQLRTDIKNALAKLSSEAELEYLQAHFYQKFTDSYGGESIKPAHKQIVLESLDGLAPVSNAFASLMEGRQQRELYQVLLSFIQSIPYHKLQSEDGLRGAGFVPPSALLANNRGDCDSKATLMLSILKNIYPKTSMAMIIVPEHAFVAFNVAAKGSDRTITLDGVVYVIADPTGPQQIEFGQVSKKTAHYLESGLVQYEIFNIQ